MIEEGTKALYVYINPFDKGIDEDCDRFIARIKAFNAKMTEQVENIKSVRKSRISHSNSLL